MNRMWLKEMSMSSSGLYKFGKSLSVSVLATRIRSVCTFCLAIVYLINLLIKSNLIRDINLIFLVIVITLSLTVVNGSAKVIGYVSFALSIMLLLFYHAPLNI